MWSKTVQGRSCFVEEKIHQPYDDNGEDLGYYEDRMTLNCVRDKFMDAYGVVE
jgi:hypothetical protein